MREEVVTCVDGWSFGFQALLGQAQHLALRPITRPPKGALRGEHPRLSPAPNLVCSPAQRLQNDTHLGLVGTGGQPTSEKGQHPVVKWPWFNT